MNTIKEKSYDFARAGGARPYDPKKDNPLLIPSWAMNSTNKEEILDAFSQAHDGKIVVLTIHGVPDVEHPWVTTSPELFKEYLDFLKTNHYKVIALQDLAKYIDVKEAMANVEADLSKKLAN